MASATVFVDDAVLGRLPGICAQDGVATTSRFRIVEEIGGSARLGILWLLILAGPLGWIVLLFLAGRDSGEHLAVEVPYSQAAYDRFVKGRRLWKGAIVLGAVAVVGLLWLTAWANLGTAGALLAFVCLFAAMVTVLIGQWRMSTNLVGVRLDASRRWVTLTNLHPAFAAACVQQREHQHLG
ncbi:MAG: hypothetical protein ACR2HV_07735 [Acidimicrobiales bacterium]